MEVNAIDLKMFRDCMNKLQFFKLETIGLAAIDTRLPHYLDWTSLKYEMLLFLLVASKNSSSPIGYFWKSVLTSKSELDLLEVCHWATFEYHRF